MKKLVFDTITTFKKATILGLPVGEWHIITQEKINDFAKATNDFQWIHVNVEKSAKYSPFKKTIAHGFMSVSMIPKMISEVVEIKSIKTSFNYGLNKVRFPNPVLG